MTSRLRRKRQTTARNTNGRTTIERPRAVWVGGHRACRHVARVAALWALGLTVAVSSRPLPAETSAAGRAVKTVAYSTGQNSSPLKWLPYRPDGSPDAMGRPSATHGRTAKASGAIRQVVYTATPGALDDPFEDMAVAVNGAQSVDPPMVPGLPPAVLPRVPAAERSILGADPPTVPPASPLLTAPELGMPPDGETGELPNPDTLHTPGTPESGTDQLAAADDADKCELPESRSTIADIDLGIVIEGTANRGKKLVGGESSNDFFPEQCPYDQGAEQLPQRLWNPTNYHWMASGLHHNPLYFEDVQLERYGHSWGPYLQPVISGGRFFLTIPVLPYKMGLKPPAECVYTLGHYRPGNCAPYMLDPLPLSVRAALFEAGVWTGGVALIP